MRDYHSIKEVIMEIFIHIEKLFENKGWAKGAPCEYTGNLTSGLQSSELIILAASPRIGKTNLALDIARFAAINGNIPTLIFSLEAPKEELGIRMLCAESQVKPSRMTAGLLLKSDWPDLTAAAGRLSEAPIFIDDSRSLNLLELCARSRLRYEPRIRLIIIDCLQLIRENLPAIPGLLGKEGLSESRQLKAAETLKELKALAKELNVPIVALSQLNRPVESRKEDKRPFLSYLRESGAIEQDADVVAFFYRDEVYNENSSDAGIAEF